MNPDVVSAVAGLVPVFIDTLKDIPGTKRFGERTGSYPVLRVHDLDGRDIGGRIDGNKVAGRIAVSEMLAQFARAAAAFRKNTR